MSETKLQLAPGAEAILAAFADAKATAKSAVDKAIICGQMLIEQRLSMNLSRDHTKSDSDKFTHWLAKNCPEIPTMTAYRWMDSASRVTGFLKLPPVIEVGETGELRVFPLSRLLMAESVEELPEAVQELRRAYFDFTEGKTMKECLAAVVVDGDNAHRITRAANGANARQTSGDARKDYPAFVARDLKEITSHLTVKNKNQPRKARQLSAVQRTQIGASMDAAIAKWPRWLVSVIEEAAKRELKLSDEERAAREEQ